MKKLFFSALIAVSIVNSAFATDVKKVNYKVTQAFNSEYAAALNVEWSVKPQFTKATFVLNNKKMEAFFDLNGERIGTSSTITLEQLPTNVKRTFAKKYAGYTVKEAIEFETRNETAYYITAENEKESVILEVKDSSLSMYKRTNKS